MTGLLGATISGASTPIMRTLHTFPSLLTSIVSPSTTRVTLPLVITTPGTVGVAGTRVGTGVLGGCGAGVTGLVCVACTSASALGVSTGVGAILDTISAVAGGAVAGGAVADGGEAGACVPACSVGSLPAISRWV